MITLNDVAWAMTQVNNTFIDAFRSNLAEAFYPNIATKIDVTAPSVTYSGLGATGGMKLLQDRMEEEDLKGYKQVITDDEYYNLIAIRAKVLEDEGTGQYLQRAQALGNEVPRFYDQKLVGMLTGGFTGVCYDGQPYFNTQHPVGVLGGGQATQSNMGTSVLAASSLDAAIAAMAGYKDDKGNAYGAVPDTLLVGNAQAPLAWDLTNNDSTGRVGKTYANSVLTAKTVPWITDNSWYLLDTKGPIKPTILQFRSDVGVQTNNNLKSEDAWFLRAWKFGILLRAGFGYGPWQIAFGSKPV